jgi:hypothetical protein
MDSVMSEPLDIPLAGGGWSHNYACPSEGARLRTLNRGQHQCPKCSQIWSGPPWDDSAIAVEHSVYAGNAYHAAVLYGLTHENRYAQWAGNVLRYYAEHYASFPFHDRDGGQQRHGAKVQCQTLSEAQWLCPLAQAFHILKQTGCLDDHEQTFIVNGLFTPALHVIISNPNGRSNWQSYHNAAVALVAAATDNRDWMNEVIYHPETGFLFQMASSLSDDGFWYEGAWGYHFFTLRAQLLIVIAAQSFGISLHENKRFQAMFLAPLESAFPDFTLPAVHDSASISLSDYNGLYEFAAAYLGIGEWIVRQSERDKLNSLLFGTINEPTNQPHVEQQSDHASCHIKDLTKSGMLHVRLLNADMTKEDPMIVLDYGPHGGFHGHYDKLNLLYYNGGHAWLTDAGALPYGNELHSRWFKQSLAHNTIIINGKSQAETEGRIMALEQRPDGIRIVAEAAGAYPGVIITREIALSRHSLSDICRVRCEQPCNVDWAMHTPGYPMTSHKPGVFMNPIPPGSLGQEDGYEQLEDLRQLIGLGRQWSLEWQWHPESCADDRFFAEAKDANDREECYIAESPAMPNIGRRSTLIRRLNSVTEAVFHTLFRSVKMP